MGQELGPAVKIDVGQRIHLHLQVVVGHPCPTGHNSVIHTGLQPRQPGIPGEATPGPQVKPQGNPPKYGHPVPVPVDEVAALGDFVTTDRLPWRIGAGKIGKNGIVPNGLYMHTGIITTKINATAAQMTKIRQVWHAARKV